jgi:predicted small lipoprotein YifL
MKKKNIFISYVVILVLSATMVACGHDTAKVTEKTTTTTQRPVIEENQTTTTTTTEQK